MPTKQPPKPAPKKRVKPPNIASIVINLDRDFIAQIDDYRYANRFDSRTKAIRDLLAKGLKAK